MKIVKLTTNLIELRTNSGIVFESFTSCITTARIICMGETVQIYVEGRYINIEASEVTATQVLPAAEVPFPALGTASELLALLNADFFEVCGAGSGGIISDSIVYPIGSRQSFAQSKTTLSSLALSSSFITNGYYRIKTDVTITSVSINITAALAGSAIIGYWKFDNQTGFWALIAKSGLFDTSISNYQTVAIDGGPAILPAGIYAIGVSASAAISISHIQDIGMDNIFGYTAIFPTYITGGTIVYSYDGNLPLAPIISKVGFASLPFTLSTIQ